LVLTQDSATMRVLIVLLVCTLACATAIDENSPLGQRIIARASQTPEDAEYVFAEVVEDIHNPDAEPLDMSAVELEAQIGTEQEAMQFPGYPAAQPGFYGVYNYAPQPQFNNNYLSNMRYAQAMSGAAPASGSSSGSASSSSNMGFGAAYAQFGAPYSAYPPIPPPMPTYLPPPPYIPLPTPGSGAAPAAQASS